MQYDKETSTMLVYTIFSLVTSQVNQERVNSLFMQVHCASSLTDDILLFCSGNNCQKSDVAYLFRFCIVSDLGF